MFKRSGERLPDRQREILAADCMRQEAELQQVLLRQEEEQALAARLQHQERLQQESEALRRKWELMNEQEVWETRDRTWPGKPGTGGKKGGQVAGGTAAPGTGGKKGGQVVGGTAAPPVVGGTARPVAPPAPVFADAAPPAPADARPVAPPVFTDAAPPAPADARPFAPPVRQARSPAPPARPVAPPAPADARPFAPPVPADARAVPADARPVAPPAPADARPVVLFSSLAGEKDARALLSGGSSVPKARPLPAEKAKQRTPPTNAPVQEPAVLQSAPANASSRRSWCGEGRSHGADEQWERGERLRAADARPPADARPVRADARPVRADARPPADARLVPATSPAPPPAAAQTAFAEETKEKQVHALWNALQKEKARREEDWTPRTEEEEKIAKLKRQWGKIRQVREAAAKGGDASSVSGVVLGQRSREIAPAGMLGGASGSGASASGMGGASGSGASGSGASAPGASVRAPGASVPGANASVVLGASASSLGASAPGVSASAPAASVNGSGASAIGASASAPGASFIAAARPASSSQWTLRSPVFGPADSGGPGSTTGFTTTVEARSLLLSSTPPSGFFEKPGHSFSGIPAVGSATAGGLVSKTEASPHAFGGAPGISTSASKTEAPLQAFGGVPPVSHLRAKMEMQSRRQDEGVLVPPLFEEGVALGGAARTEDRKQPLSFAPIGAKRTRDERDDHGAARVGTTEKSRGRSRESDGAKKLSSGKRSKREKDPLPANRTESLGSVQRLIQQFEPAPRAAPGARPAPTRPAIPAGVGRAPAKPGDRFGAPPPPSGEVGGAPGAPAHNLNKPEPAPQSVENENPSSLERQGGIPTQKMHQINNVSEENEEEEHPSAPRPPPGARANQASPVSWGKDGNGPFEVKSGPLGAKNGSFVEKTPEAKIGLSEAKSPSEAKTGLSEAKNGPPRPKNGPAEAKSGPAEAKSGPCEPKNGPSGAKNGPPVEKTSEAKSPSEAKTSEAKNGPSGAKNGPPVEKTSEAKNGPPEAKNDPPRPKNGPPTTQMPPSLKRKSSEKKSTADRKVRFGPSSLKRKSSEKDGVRGEVRREHLLWSLAHFARGGTRHKPSVEGATRRVAPSTDGLCDTNEHLFILTRASYALHTIMSAAHLPHTREPGERGGGTGSKSNAQLESDSKNPRV